MPRPVSATSRSETLVSLIVLALLACIAAGVYRQQFNFTPWNPNGDTSQSLAPASDKLPSALVAHAGPDLAAMSPMESFDRETLSDKIDGKAEFYLPAGFLAMQCQRFTLKADASNWMEVFVYDMGEAINAFTVYSKQRRPGVTEVADLAYRTPNSLHFVHGKYYVEIVAAQADPAVDAAMEGYWKKFVADVAAGKGGPVAEVSLFPAQGLRAGSVMRTTVEDFGIEGFDNVFTALYDVDGVQVTAFLSRRGSDKEAGDLAAAYGRYFVSFGGKASATGEPLPGATIVEMDGIYKVVLARGRFVLGTHESSDRAAAWKVAILLNEKLSKEKP
ncbi:MAG: DUF6599 family protein [Phycisphaerae bacterium]|jgi:hypothetical protein